MEALGKKIGVVGPILDLSSSSSSSSWCGSPASEPDGRAPRRDDDAVHPVLGSFYDEVLRELIAAMGAALFFANLYALLRRHRDADRIAARTVERGRARAARCARRPSRRRSASSRRRRSAARSLYACSASS